MPIKGRHTHFFKKLLIRNGKLDVYRLKNLLCMYRKCKERQETFATQGSDSYYLLLTEGMRNSFDTFAGKVPKNLRNYLPAWLLLRMNFKNHHDPTNCR